MKAAHQKPYTMFSYAVFFFYLWLFLCECSFDAATFATASDGVLCFSVYLSLACMYGYNVCSWTFVLTRLLFTVCLSVSCYSCAQMIWIAIAGIYIYAVFMCFLVLFFFLSKQHKVRDELNDKKKQRMREKKNMSTERETSDTTSITAGS